MFISVGMSLVYTVLYILILSAFAEPLAWICIVAVNIGLFAVAIGGWFMREESKKKVLASSSGAEDAVTLTPEQLTAELDLQMKLSWACIISAILGC